MQFTVASRLGFSFLLQLRLALVTSTTNASQNVHSAKRVLRIEVGVVFFDSILRKEDALILQTNVALFGECNCTNEQGKEGSVVGAQHASPQFGTNADFATSIELSF